MNEVIPPGLDLSALTVAQMNLLQQEIEKHKAVAKQRARKAAKEHISQILDGAGLAVSDLLELFPSLTRVVSNPRSVAYRHPQKPRLTWTGKGRKPAWIADYLAADGHTLQDLKVE